MKVSKDAKMDVAYIQLRSGKVVKTVEFKRGLLIDFDKNGEIIGIEVLSLQKLAPLLASGKIMSKPSKKVA